MHGRIANSTLYRLIEAGQLARAALLHPLVNLGLQPGDDAIILSLKKKKPLSDARLGALTGLTPYQLQPRLDRLVALSMIQRLSMDSERTPATRLTARGRQVRRTLREVWHQLEQALTHDLDPAHQKILRKTLKRIIHLLSL